MNEFEGVLVRVVEALDRLRIPYLVTGGLAVTYYGEPRTTHDIDLVVQVSRANVEPLASELAADFYVDVEAAKVALAEGGMFNAIHEDSGFKVDFWMLTEDGFEQTRFARRVKVCVLGVTMSLPTAEDVIISKLDWYRQSDVDKHYSDALGVVRVQAGKLDAGYVEKWCRIKATLDSWLRLQREAEL